MPLHRVTPSIVDLLAKPEIHAERVSQAFCFEVMEVINATSGFSQVKRSRDGYIGWVDSRYLIPDKKAKGSLYRIAKTNTALLDAKTSLALAPYRLWYGTEVMISRVVNRHAFLILPNGQKAFLKLSDLTRDKSGKPRWRSLWRDAVLFLGTPYLWGGISPLGCDCSGLVQTLYGQIGVLLPRDTKDQRKAGLRVERKDTRPGDLIFSPGHVAIALGGGLILHSSRAYGGVAIQSLNQTDDNYRKDLDTSYEETRRILPIA